MCHTDQFITLSESDCATISWCKGCKTFSLIYNTCCASFTEPELTQFRDLLDNLQPENYHLHALGKDRTIIRCPNAWVGFCLAKDDVSAMIELISEACTVFDAFRVIYS